MKYFMIKILDYIILYIYNTSNYIIILYVARNHSAV